MTDSLHASTQKLIQEIERKDRRFRLFQSVAVFVIGAAIVVLLLFSYRQSQRQVETLKALQQSSQQRSRQIRDLQDHMDCLFKLATTPHSTTSPPLVSDIKSCQLTPTDTLGGSVDTTKSVSHEPTASPSPANHNGSPPANNAASVPAAQTTPTPQPSTIQRVVNFVKGLF